MHVGPADLQAGLQRGRRRQRAVGLRRQLLALGQAGGELLQRRIVFGQRPALVRRRRRAGVSQADAPVVARRDQHEREQPARQRLRLVAVPLVDAATALLAQEDAAAVGPVVEPPFPRPRRAVTDERGEAAEVLVAVPALGVDALLLLVGDGDEVLLAAGTADVAIPVLQDGEMTDGERHGPTGNWVRSEGLIPPLYQGERRGVSPPCVRSAGRHGGLTPRRSPERGNFLKKRESRSCNHPRTLSDFPDGAVAPSGSEFRRRARIYSPPFRPRPIVAMVNEPFDRVVGSPCVSHG